MITPFYAIHVICVAVLIFQIVSRRTILFIVSRLIFFLVFEMINYFRRNGTGLASGNTKWA